MSSGMMASTGVVAGDDVAMAADGTTSGDSTAPLPQSVAYVPVVKPGSGFPALQDGTTGPRPRPPPIKFQPLRQRQRRPLMRKLRAPPQQPPKWCRCRPPIPRRRRHRHSTIRSM